MPVLGYLEADPVHGARAELQQWPPQVKMLSLAMSLPVEAIAGVLAAKRPRRRLGC